ncbi:MAG: low molecular weight protein-tyrosine-phosphatase [Microbacteriaceae bacterium]
MTFALPSEDEPVRFRVSFICSGNICRSPMAEVVFRDLAAQAGHAAALSITSAGTGDWHVGEPADARTVTALHRAGYDGSQHRAQQFDVEQFDELDLVVALDRSHQRILNAWARSDLDRAKVQLLLDFDPTRPVSRDVPDPYYSDAAQFDSVLATIERACRALLSQLEPALRQGAR